MALFPFCRIKRNRSPDVTEEQNDAADNVLELIVHLIEILNALPHLHGLVSTPEAMRVPSGDHATAYT